MCGSCGGGAGWWVFVLGIYLEFEIVGIFLFLVCGFFILGNKKGERVWKRI